MPGVQTAILAHQFNCNSDTINSSLCLGPSAAPASCCNYQAHTSASSPSWRVSQSWLARASPQLPVSGLGVNSTSASDRNPVAPISGLSFLGWQLKWMYLRCLSVWKCHNLEEWTSGPPLWTLGRSVPLGSTAASHYSDRVPSQKPSRPPLDIKSRHILGMENFRVLGHLAFRSRSR